MAGVSITVQGSFESFHPAERAIIRLKVGFEGPDKAKAYTSTARAASEIGEQLGSLYAPDHGPVTWWSSEQIRTWSQRPWNQDGKQLPLVHHAMVTFQAKFSDFARLGEWISDVAARPGVAIEQIEWALTERRRIEVTRQAREGAVGDAQAKAKAYADSLGLAKVRVIAIADQGMLGDRAGAHALAGGGMARAAYMSARGGPEISFVPEDIAVSARVDAMFEAE